MGVTFPGQKVSFVPDGRWDIVPHELGHSFGLVGHRADSTPPRDGYWVERGLVREDVSDLMQGVGDAAPAFPNLDVWIGTDHYEQIQRNYFLTDPLDPEILLVTGIVNKAGTVVYWGPVYRVPSGYLDVEPEGDFVASLRGADGDPVFELPFSLSFEGVEGFGPMSEFPFTLKLPYVPGAMTLGIARLDGGGGTTLNISSTLLRDAVAAQPPAAFIKPGANRRKELLAKIDLFAARLASGDTASAAELLRHDVCKHIERWSTEPFTPETPFQSTRTELVELCRLEFERLRQ